MAAPTIQNHNVAAAAGSFLLSVWMAKLQEFLFEAGWTIEYADSDAIGSGSAGAPAWDKAPANETDAGVAVYRMPANGHATQWFVRFRPGWHNGTARPYLRGLKIGTSRDGDDVLGGSTEMAPTGMGGNTDAFEWQLAVSEDGFALVNGVTNLTPSFGLERARLTAGGTSDDIIAWNKAVNNVAGLEARHVSVSVGQVNNAPFAALTGHYLGTHGVIPSLENQAASQVLVLGPYYPGGDPFFGPPRHAVLASPGDVAGGALPKINVDGGDKSYQAMSASISTTLGIWLVATE